ncbi:hypothetical protein SAMN00790413_04867 [Deinococcus hopiensis KR-140]|uniref:Uncharacterized protein n=1 Tax=Deinococcus hopiensis KR-140 TaxID=695939 RepID=A0A1W1UM37_9DEIO|nr:hypothetical protein SAMN00790413_04867 [Deinococcus hopiensis KR-140]
MNGDLTVQRGLGLKDAEQDLRQATEGVGTVMREAFFEVRGERVNMRKGGTGTDHTSICRPFSGFSTS